MDKVTALKQFATDPRLPREEREDARTALAILASSDGPDQEAAEAALQELGVPAPLPQSPDLSPLAAELLRYSKLAETERTSYGEPNKPLFAYVPLNEFCDFVESRLLTQPQVAALWQEFIDAKKRFDPAWVKVFTDGQRRMRDYFVERLDGIMARLRAAGKPTQEILNEVRQLFEQWKDSGVLPEDVKARMRKILEGAK